MEPRRPTVWDNVPARRAQASDESVFDSVTGALGKKLIEPSVRAAVQESHVSAAADRLSLVITLVGAALTLYLISQSARRK